MTRTARCISRPGRGCVSGAWHHRASRTAALLVGLVAGCSATRPNQGEIHFADGLERLALGDSLAALQLFERANYELGGDPRLLLHIGRLQAATGTLEGRARARATLDEASRRDPHGAATRAALGELLREQRYQRASTAALTEAVRRDPRQPRPWMLLAHNLLDSYFIDMEVPPLLDSAVACYQRALRLDSTLTEARYQLAFLNMHLGNHATARSLVLAGMPHDCPGRFGLLLVAIDYHLHRFEEAQTWLDSTLACMTEEQRDSWLGLTPLLHPDSVGAYRVHGTAERDSIVRGYWWGQDPTPATLVNERLVEHVCRAVESDFYFAVPWRPQAGRNSDRGEIYLRYGPPALARRRMEFDLPAWEWRYRTRGDYDIVFFFIDWVLNGDYTRLRRGVGSDFIEPSALEAHPNQTSVVFHAPPGGWRHVVRQFRGDHGRTALEIAYEFGPLDGVTGLSVDAAAWRGPGDLVRRLRTSVKRSSLYDAGEHRIGRLRFELHPEEPATLGLELAGLEPHIAGIGGDSTAVALRLAWRAMGRDTLHLVHYDATHLMMSDLMLAYDVHDGSGSLFDMGGVVAVPRVDDRITGQTLQLYFEVYPGDRVLHERTAVAVRYAVRPLPPRTWNFWDQLRPSFHDRMDADQKPAVAATFTFLPEKDLERQQLAVDLGALQPGVYELQVELVDTASGTTTSRSVDFEYAPAPPPASPVASGLSH